MHWYAVDKMNQYYLLLDAQVQGQLEGAGTSRRQRRMML